MTEAEAILKMIESVDPADEAKLDEIDARVWCWRSDCDYGGGDFDNGSTFKAIPKRGAPPFFKSIPLWERYTRSRNALKSIRQEGWRIKAAEYFQGGFCFELSKYFPPPKGVHVLRDGDALKVSPLTGLPTEELAELHAIIQAIEYERSATSAT
jgi:hypothetical protein